MSAEKPTAAPSKSRQCLICGCTTKVYHHSEGDLSCDSCSGFFKRKIEGLKKQTSDVEMFATLLEKAQVCPKCPKEENCTMDENTRKKCKPCRLRKCIKIGMKPAVVGASLQGRTEGHQTVSDSPTDATTTGPTENRKSGKGATAISQKIPYPASHPDVYGTSLPPMRVCTFNACSVNNKQSEIANFVWSKNISVLLLTETFLKRKGTDAREECPSMIPPGYTLQSCPRPSEKARGGVAFLFCSSLVEDTSFKDDFPFHHTTFELAQLTVTKSVPHPIQFFCLYRPPHKKNKQMETFLTEFDNFLMYCSDLQEKVVIMGDFNFHYGMNTTEALKVQSMLQMFSLSQCVREATHEKGNILDWIVFRELEQIVIPHSVVVYKDSFESDHYPVTCELNLHSVDNVDNDHKQLMRILQDINDGLSKIEEKLNLHSVDNDHRQLMRILQDINDGLSKIEEKTRLSTTGRETGSPGTRSSMGEPSLKDVVEQLASMEARLNNKMTTLDSSKDERVTSLRAEIGRDYARVQEEVQELREAGSPGTRSSTAEPSLKDVVEQLASMEARLNNKMNTLDSSMDERVTSLRAEIGRDYARVQEEVQELREEVSGLRRENQELRDKLNDM